MGVGWFILYAYCGYKIQYFKRNGFIALKSVKAIIIKTIWGFFKWVCASRLLHFLMLSWGQSKKVDFYALNTHQPTVQRNQGNSQCGRGGQPGMKHLPEELYKTVSPHKNAANWPWVARETSPFQELLHKEPTSIPS